MAETGKIRPKATMNDEAFQLLLRLAEKAHPLALFELGSRYYSSDS